ncbi:reactive intermediate/imine deaminase [Pseudohongiella acticola]|uniref:Reactive intermediate/imine deaminase n=1 Tax=Pseudohongiella acticola TaxID=1524254 RepID=A0A1E8CL92_9GAMM|nr:RidA family protein [Pseudohongiella acticola]OFE13241.1 reactive intermediate/imine deaminase [Pseudohongiella acticola]
MADKHVISTDRAPSAIGPYSQAIKSGNMVFLSGQIPLDPVSMDVVAGDVEAQARQVLENLSAVAAEAGGTLDDCVKLTIYMTDLNNFAIVNTTMQQYFQTPYPARATIEVSALPRGVQVEIDAIMILPATA